MNLLVIATKAPWPPVDGGRFLLSTTLQGLAAAGHRVTLVAPADPTRFDLDEVAAALAEWCTPHLVPTAPSPPAVALLRALRKRMPVAIARHALPAVSREVERVLAGRSFDLVHCEQLQALPQAEPAFARGLPVVLRAQNVESDLWRAAAERRGGWKGKALARVGQSLERWEGTAVRRVAATLALTGEDAARLSRLAEGAGRVRIVRAPFPDLPPGSSTLPGAPALVVMGSRGWMPNEDSVSWFLTEVWPTVRAVLPRAILHLFGAGPPEPVPGVIVHPSPEDSAEAFAPGSILAVPLRIASGVRIKVLEAWARGVPVVGTPEALAGLEIQGEEALTARDGPEFAHALTRLHEEPGLAAAVIAAGRRARRERHGLAAVTAELAAAYRDAVRA